MAASQDDSSQDKKGELSEDTLKKLVELRSLLRLLELFSFRRCIGLVAEEYKYEVVDNQTGLTVCVLPQYYVENLQTKLNMLLNIAEGQVSS